MLMPRDDAVYFFLFAAISCATPLLRCLYAFHTFFFTMPCRCYCRRLLFTPFFFIRRHGYASCCRFIVIFDADAMPLRHTLPPDITL